MAKRAEVCKKVYIDKDGTESRSAHSGVVAQEFRFANDSTHRVVFEDLPEDIQFCAGRHGVSQKLGDEFSGAKGDPNIAEQDFLSMLEQLQAGNWLVGSVKGLPQISMVLEAIIRAYKAKGDPMNDERIAAARESLKDKEVLEGAKDDEPIAAQITTIRRERDEAREAAAHEKAEGVDIKSKF